MGKCLGLLREKTGETKTTIKPSFSGFQIKRYDLLNITGIYINFNNLPSKQKRFLNIITPVIK